jgi:pyridoxal 5'-phosphate synthase pdxT subunit
VSTPLPQDAAFGLDRPVVGVLAVQGAFAEHELPLIECGALPRQIRSAEALAGVDALVIPGGESTTLRIVAGDSGLVAALRAAVGDGLPVLGTCAGLIAIADEIIGGDDPLVGGLDVTVRRNAYGAQVASFEATLDAEGGPIDAVFIRAPRIVRTGADVEVIASYGGVPVAVRQGHLIGTSFHPELTDERRFHAWLVAAALARRDQMGTTRGKEHHVGAQ